MGWYGSWRIEYKGKDKDKFVNLSKMIIPNFRERFEVDENVLECTRDLSWYSADDDIETIMSYLDEGDEIHTSIDGETHPIVNLSEAEKAGVSYDYLDDEDEYDDYDEDEEYDDYDEDENDDEVDEDELEETEDDDPLVELTEETQIFTKKNGKVVMECPFVDEDRCSGYVNGNGEYLSYMIDKNEIDELKENLEFWANSFGKDKEFLPIASKYFSKLLSGYKISGKSEIGKIIKDFKKASSSAEGLEKFFDGYLSENEIDTEEEDYSKDALKLIARVKARELVRLGGKETISRLVEVQGYTKAYMSLKAFGMIEIPDLDIEM